MSFPDDTTPQDLGPERLKPARGTPILSASVEATPTGDLCTGPIHRDFVRARILAWLADGAREVTWALCSLPRDQWAAPPPAHLDTWPALRHARHLAMREAHVTLPLACNAVDPSGTRHVNTLEFEQADAAWDPAAAIASAEDILQSLGETRFELLQRLETAPDAAWDRPIQTSAGLDAAEEQRPVQLDWLLLSARQHELEHLAAMWRVALHWDRVPRVPMPGVPLHPADRLEESH